MVTEGYQEEIVMFDGRTRTNQNSHGTGDADVDDAESNPGSNASSYVCSKVENATPWSDLQRIKKEANEVAMMSSSERNLDTTDASCQSPLLNPSESKNTVSSNHIVRDESQEYTMERFDELLERNGRDPVAMDHETHVSNDGETKTVVTDNDDPETHKEKSEDLLFCKQKHRTVWSNRMFRSPGLVADAPSGILLVFDRILDCIDPHCGPNHFREFGSLDEDDQSSLWSLSVSRNSHRESREDSSSACSLTTDERSLEAHPLFNHRLANDWATSYERHKANPIPKEELKDGYEWIFPCWEDPERKSALPSRSLRDLAASDVGRKRKWAGKDLMSIRSHRPATTSATLPSIHSEIFEAEVFGEVSWGKGSEKCKSDPSKPSCDDAPDEPCDFPSRESSLLVLHQPIPLDAPFVVCKLSTSDDSSLSELFDGLMVSTPSDERQQEEEEELERITDRTSITEETSTLSFSYSMGSH